MDHPREAEQLNREFSALFSRLTIMLNNIKEERDFGEDGGVLFKECLREFGESQEAITKWLGLMSKW